MPYPNIKKMDDSIYSKSKPFHSTNFWIHDIDYEVNGPHPTILMTNTFNIKHYDLTLSFNHVMDQTKNHNFFKIKISQNHYIP
jgi:hypothetical protein